MSNTSVPVDLLNPGQVFACLGLMEMTEILHGPCRVRFNYTSDETECRFELDAPDDCIRKSVRFLASCKVVAIAPQPRAGEKPLLAVERRVETITCVGSFFPGGVPDSMATLPVRLSFEGVDVPIEHWLDDFRTGRDNVKFWAGEQGKSGAAKAQGAVALLAASDTSALDLIALDPFAFTAPMSSSFRFDWRRDYIPLNAGFSPNEHKSRMSMVGFPVVELLAAIGVQNARPYRVNPKTNLAYRYYVSNEWLPTCLARAVLGSEISGFPVRAFRMDLGWPGKPKQARCIINAEEEQT